MLAKCPQLTVVLQTKNEVIGNYHNLGDIVGAGWWRMTRIRHLVGPF